MSYNGWYKPKHPEKYIGDSTNIVWRSTWERKVMVKFDTTPNILQWSSEELIINYFDPITNKMRRYFPDFYVKIKQKDGNIQEYIVEVKPYAQTQLPKKPKRKTKRYNKQAETYITNQAKFSAAHKFCESQGWKFQILTEQELYGAKTK